MFGISDEPMIQTVATSICTVSTKLVGGAAAILAVFYDRYATDSLMTSVEQQNMILVSFIANDLTSRFPRHFKTRIHDAEDLATTHHSQLVKDIDAILKDLLKSLPVLKVKAYRDGPVPTSRRLRARQGRGLDGFCKGRIVAPPADRTGPQGLPSVLPITRTGDGHG